MFQPLAHRQREQAEKERAEQALERLDNFGEPHRLKFVWLEQRHDAKTIVERAEPSVGLHNREWSRSTHGSWHDEECRSAWHGEEGSFLGPGPSRDTLR